MRIVAGRAGGRVLAVPGKGTRPTSDRVREALFARLEHLDAVDGARVLDLYAGSGALGLEAMSRGAAEAVLVEASAAAASVCRRNAATVGLPGVAVVAERVLPYLRRSGAAGAAGAAGAVDLVLVDPPYDVDEEALAAVLAALEPRLAPAAVLVVERSTRSPEPAWPSGTARFDSRRYGETTVWFAEPAGDGAVASGAASAAPAP
jgi:16S rRNA (guanine966-N2)-methyltransferase